MVNQERAKNIGLSILVITLVSALFYLSVNDFWIKHVLNLNTSHGDKIATVITRNSDVRRKPFKQLTWQKLEEGEEIYDSDSVFTGSNSSADVEFVSGAKLKVAPNSLVVFKNRKKDLELNLEFGKFRGKVQKNRVVFVKSGETESSIYGSEDANFQITRKETGAEIAVISGKIEVKTKEGTKESTQEIFQNQKIVVAKKGEITEVKEFDPEKETAFTEIKSENQIDEVENEVENEEEVSFVAEMTVPEEGEVLEEIENEALTLTSPKVESEKLESEEKERALSSVDTVESFEEMTKEKDLLSTLKPKEKHGIYLWFGLGANAVLFDQTIREFSTDVSYTATGGVSTFVKAEKKLNNNWKIEGSFNDSPGEVQSPSGSGTVSNGSFHWLSLSGEGVRALPQWAFNVFGLPSQAHWRAGFQHHIVPFLRRQSSLVFTVDKSSLSSASVGLGADFGVGQKLFYQAFMRYQYPFSTGTLFDIEPSISFDGSVSAVYKMNEDWQIGAFWYGQWLQYDFSYFDTFSSSNVGGSQFLFFTNIELRMGYQF